MTYDDVPEIAGLYSAFRTIPYGISYSAKDRYKGREIAFFSEHLQIPDVKDLAIVGNRTVVRSLRKRVHPA